MSVQDKKLTISIPIDQQTQDSNNTYNIMNSPKNVINSNINIQQQQNLNQQQTRLQLKQKLKQNKTLEAKNKKLQAKFIELFKQQKALKKDWGVLTAMVKIILPELEERAVGRYDSQELKQLWNKRQSKILIKIQQLQQQIVKQKQRAQIQAAQIVQQKIDKVTRQCKQKVQSLNKQLQSYKKNTKNLSDQLSDYDKKFQSKADQVSKLTKQKLKLEHQINQLKMKSITDQLVEKKDEIYQKISNQRNQILGLKHQVEQLMQKRDQLRTQLKNTKIVVQKLKAMIVDKDKEMESVIQESKMQEKSKKINNLEEIQLENKVSINSSQSQASRQEKFVENMHHMIGDEDYIHREYMKNVFIRYMKSWAKGDDSQTQILLNLIQTMLKFTHIEKKMIAEKKKGWWQLY